MAQAKKEILKIDEILPYNVRLINASLKESKIDIREKSKQIRLSLYHYVTHAIAILIIVPYIILLLFESEIPLSYTTLVSLVIGFYFGRSLSFEWRIVNKFVNKISISYFNVRLPTIKKLYP